MLGKVARAAYVITVATMIAAYAMSAGKSQSVEPNDDQHVVYWYC